MKIGLIGINMYPKYLNFACGLHTYAFQQFLLQNGIKTTIIDYKPVYFSGFDMRHPSDYYKKRYTAVKKKAATTLEQKAEKAELLNELQEKIEAWEPLYAEREIRYDKFKHFIDENYIKTDEKYDSDLLEIQDPGFDCYICVTDVIWNLLPVHTYDRGFFLASKSMDGKQKISYAASRGVPKPYTDSEKSLFFQYINDIDSISVREKSLKEFIETNSNKKAELVLDPVLLHDKAFWQRISVKPKEEKYILLYYVMEQAADTIRRAVEYAKKHNLLIVELSDRPVKHGRVNDTTVRHIARYDVGLEEWLGYIEYAECIFTNSFHGCCYSILFEKLFYVGNRNGDKVTNCLELFGLQDLRMPKKGLPFDSMPKQIDYIPVRARLEEMRKSSQQFILNAIQEAEMRLKQGTKRAVDYEQYRRQICYPLNYHSGKAGVSHKDIPADYEVNILSNGINELSSANRLYKNNGSEHFENNPFSLNEHKFVGWNIRIKIDTRWFWYMNDNSLQPVNKYHSNNKSLTFAQKVLNKIFRRTYKKKRKLFKNEAPIPYIPVGRIRLMIAEAVWK